MPKVSSFEYTGARYWAQNGGEAWSISSPDADTLRFEVRSGDQWQYDPSWKERSEIGGDTIHEAGKTISVSYDFMVEPGSDNTADWIVLGQFHADDDHTSPPFAIELVGEKMAVVLRYALPDAASPTTVYEWMDAEDIERGHYYHIDIAVNFDIGGDGFLKVWRDAEPIVDYDGPIGYGYGVYWKHGIYREESKETIAVNYRDFALDTGDGVTIVGTGGADRIDPETSPEGQPIVTALDDLVRGAAGSDRALAGDGDDTLIMGRGNDRASGGLGDDTLNGGFGNDRLFGGVGNDILKGGKGGDTFVFAAGFGADAISDFGPGEDRLKFDKAVFADFEAVLAAAAETVGGLTISAGEDSLFLAGLSLDRLDAADVLFV